MLLRLTLIFTLLTSPVFSQLNCSGGCSSSGVTLGPQYAVPTAFVSSITSGTQINWTGASTANVSGALNFLTTNNAGSFSMEALQLNAPGSTPYSFVIQIIPNFQLAGTGNAFAEVGLFFGDGTKFSTFGLVYQGANQPRFITRTWSTFSSGVSNVNVGNSLGVFNASLYMKIRNDGTNRVTSFSMDGTNFTQFDSVGVNSFLTPSKVGIYLNQASMMVLTFTQGT